MPTFDIGTNQVYIFVHIMRMIYMHLLHIHTIFVRHYYTTATQKGDTHSVAGIVCYVVPFSRLIYLDITMTNSMTVQPLFYLMMTSSNGNIFRVTHPLCGEFTGHRWILLTRPSVADVIFDLRLNKWLSKPLLGWWFETLPIYQATKVFLSPICSFPAPSR